MRRMPGGPARPLYSLLSITCISIGVAACGSSPEDNLVQSVRILTEVVDGEDHVNATIGLNTGGAVMPSFQLPIMHPDDPGSPYGTVSMRPRVGGGSELELDFNLSRTANLPHQDPRLPNGSRLPVGGIDDATVITLKIGGSGNVYVAMAQGVALIGTAITLKEIGEIARYVGNANLFLPFNLPEGIRGVAGIFSGRESNSSGFGVFIDAGAALEPILENPGGAFLAQVFRTNRLTFDEVKPNRRRERTMRRKLYRMSSRGQHLHLD